MKSRSRVLYGCLAVLLLVGLLSGCDVVKQMVGFGTATPSPTPYPTSTPYPTYTPIPEEGTGTGNTWRVKILSAKRTMDFEGWSYDEASGGEFIVVTAEITNLTSETAMYYPKAVELLYYDNPRYPGEAVVVSVYKAQNGDIRDFLIHAPLVAYVRVDQTITEKFAFGINAEGHTEFMFLFPGVDPIYFMVND